MILLQLFLLKGLLYALIAIPIRVSLALTRGFDLGVAAFTLLAAETLLFACTRTSPPVAFIVVLIFTVLVTLTWYWLTNRVFSDDERGPTRILIAGLGLSGLASGLSGVLGGPGLRCTAGGYCTRFMYLCRHYLRNSYALLHRLG